MKTKARKILTISMIAVTVLWAIAILLFYIAALDEVWGLLAFVLIVPYFAPFLIGILAILGCVRSLLSEKQTGELRRLSCLSLMLVLRHRDGIEIRMRGCFLHKANEDRSLL